MSETGVSASTGALSSAAGFLPAVFSDRFENLSELFVFDTEQYRLRQHTVDVHLGVVCAA